MFINCTAASDAASNKRHVGHTHTHARMHTHTIDAHTHTHTHEHTNSLTHSNTHSRMQALTHSFNPPHPTPSLHSTPLHSTHSLCHPLTHACTYSHTLKPTVQRSLTCKCFCCHPVPAQQRIVLHPKTPLQGDARPHLVDSLDHHRGMHSFFPGSTAATARHTRQPHLSSRAQFGFNIQVRFLLSQKN